jgi:hypothetical protein
VTPASANSIAPAKEALYVYCVAGGAGHRVFGPIGLDGQVVYTVGNGDIRAVVHSCQAEPYQSQAHDVVEGWVVTHQNVVRAASADFGTVLPMAFDMIVRPGPGGAAMAMLEAWLDEKRARFGGLLSRFAGHAEYGVQVFWDGEAVAADLVSGDETLRRLRDEIQTQPKGMAHLLRQKLAKAIRAAMEARADRCAQDFYARIRHCVADIRVDPLKKADGGRQMLLNLSCLMPEGSGDLGRVLDEINQAPGIAVRFTGPWPPYSFVGA